MKTINNKFSEQGFRKYFVLGSIGTIGLGIETLHAFNQEGLKGATVPVFFLLLFIFGLIRLFINWRHWKRTGEIYYK